MKFAPIVIYHAGCWDGFCAAWLFRRAFPDAEFHPTNYGDGVDPPDCVGRDVYIADFCYPLDTLVAIRRAALSLTVLDHHKSARPILERLADNPDCVPTHVVFDLEKSGGRLAWEYLYKGGFLPAADRGIGVDRDGMVTPGPWMALAAEAPWLVKYTEDRDLWRHQLPWSKEINAALRSYPLDFALWDTMHTRYPNAYFLVEAGQGILRRERQIIDQHVGFAREITLAGHRVLAVNATVLVSEIVGELAKGRPFAAGFFDRLTMVDGQPATQRVWSLRSEAAGVDVSEVAAQFGGGGHKHAAGFEEIKIGELKW